MPVNSANLLDLVDSIGQLSAAGGEVVQALPGLSAAARGFCRAAAYSPGGRALQLLDIPNVCSPFWEADNLTAPEDVQRFTGGQCHCVDYSWVITFSGLSNPAVPTTPQQGSGRGPVNIEKRRVGDISQVWVSGSNLACNGIVENRILSVFDPDNQLNFSVDMERVDGAPDDCGNPPSNFVPAPGTPSVPFGAPQIVPGPDGNDYEINVSPVAVGVDGSVSIPVTIDGVEVNIGGGGPGSGGGSPTGGPTSTGPSTPGPAGGQPGDVPAGPEGSRCIAVMFEFAGFHSGMGRVLGGDDNVRYYGVFGNADVYASGDSGEGRWSGNVDLQSQSVTIGVPASGMKITRFRANLKPGLSYTATPVYQIIE